jgi:hypothetical protein
MGFLTTDEFVAAMDCVLTNQHHYASTSKNRDLILADGQVNNFLAIQQSQKTDSLFDIQIKAVQKSIDSLTGVTHLTLQEQRNLHVRDSLMNILMHLENQKQNERNAYELKQKIEDEFKEAERQEASRTNKVINVKRGRPKKQKNFGNRILAPVWGQ